MQENLVDSKFVHTPPYITVIYFYHTSLEIRVRAVGFFNQP